MKYFTKYLPVDEEITEGDKFLLNENHPQGRLRTAYRIAELNYWDGKSWDNVGPAYYIDPTPKEGSGFVYSIDCKKAKLFLCSSDIQVGDKVFLENGYNYFATVVDKVGGSDRDIVLNKMPKQRENGTLDSKEMVKVIGEISPEALEYVKEGIKIEESQIEVWKDYVNTPAERTIIKIKCPTCKIYH